MSIREPRLARNVYSGVRVQQSLHHMRTLPRVLVVGNLIFVEGGIGAGYGSSSEWCSVLLHAPRSRKRVFFYLCYSVLFYSCWRPLFRADHVYTGRHGKRQARSNHLRRPDTSRQRRVGDDRSVTTDNEGAY